MSKVYATNGEKMNAVEIMDELRNQMNGEQKSALGKSLIVYRDIKRSDMRLAHAILDTYRTVDPMTEQGARVRKLLDNLMNKYQKSTTTPDGSPYHMFICDIIRGAGLNDGKEE